MMVTQPAVTDTALYLAKCGECHGHKWVSTPQAVDAWLKHHPHDAGGAG